MLATAQAIWDLATPIQEHVFLRDTRKGATSDLVAITGDDSHPGGRALLEACLTTEDLERRRAKVAAQVAQQTAEGVAPPQAVLITRSVPRARLLSVLRSMHLNREVIEALSMPAPSGRFWAVIADGRVEATTHQVPAYSTIDRDRDAVANHESGHAVLDAIAGNGIKKICLGANYRLGCWGGTAQRRRTSESPEMEASVLFSGPLAEAKYLARLQWPSARFTPVDLTPLVDYLVAPEGQVKERPALTFLASQGFQQWTIAEGMFTGGDRATKYTRGDRALIDGALHWVQYWLNEECIWRAVTAVAELLLTRLGDDDCIEVAGEDLEPLLEHLLGKHRWRF